MPTPAATSPAVPMILAQQGANNQAAYEGGQKVGQIFLVIMAVAIVFWVLGKVFRRR